MPSRSPGNASPARRSAARARRHHHPRIQFVDAACAAVAHFRTWQEGTLWPLARLRARLVGRRSHRHQDGEARPATVCLVGDGAFLMGQIEALWAARRFEAPVLYIVFNNRSFNDTRMRVSAIAPRLRESKLDMGSYLGNPDVSFERRRRPSTSMARRWRKPGEIAAGAGSRHQGTERRAAVRDRCRR